MATNDDNAQAADAVASLEPNAETRLVIPTAPIFDELRRLKTKRRSRILTGQLQDLLRRVDAMPDLDTRSPDEILGYDENGLSA